MIKTDLPEPWLRGTLTDVPPLQRAVLHALELAKEDLERWCDGMSDEELNHRPGGIAPVAFHLRHIARSMDRLLTYAEGKQLSAEQISAMNAELDPYTSRNELMAELVVAFAKSGKRIRIGSYRRLAWMDTQVTASSRTTSEMRCVQLPPAARYWTANSRR